MNISTMILDTIQYLYENIFYDLFAAILVTEILDGVKCAGAGVFVVLIEEYSVWTQMVPLCFAPI